MAEEKLNTITLEDLTKDIEWLNARKCGCCHHEVATTDGGTTLYIVVGWGDGFDEAPACTPNADGTLRICGKIGYQHANNAMQADYEVDFYMPYDPKTGDVDNTSTEVSSTQDSVDYLNEAAKRVWNDWKNDLDSLG